jgi:hypothetical protein
MRAVPLGISALLQSCCRFTDHPDMVRRLSDDQLARARSLRRAMTVAETILWRGLRGRGIGAKFRRQVPIGPYIGDFVCIAARLIIELDGPPHEAPGGAHWIGTAMSGSARRAGRCCGFRMTS